jgi:hypothetical protein
MVEDVENPVNDPARQRVVDRVSLRAHQRRQHLRHHRLAAENRGILLALHCHLRTFHQHAHRVDIPESPSVLRHRMQGIPVVKRGILRVLQQNTAGDLRGKVRNPRSVRGSCCVLTSTTTVLQQREPLLVLRVQICKTMGLHAPHALYARPLQTWL